MVLQANMAGGLSTPDLGAANEGVGVEVGVAVDMAGVTAVAAAAAEDRLVVAGKQRVG